MKKRVLSLLLALVMVFSLIPAAAAAEIGFATEDTEVPVLSTDGPLSLPQGDYNNVMDVEAPEASEEQAPAELPASNANTQATVADTGMTKLEGPETERFSESEASNVPDADELVTFMVVIKDQPLLELYSAGEIADNTAAVASYEKKQISALDRVKTSLQMAFGSEEGFELGYTYTIATSAVSVTTAYGNKAKIAAMPNVERVYVAPMFHLPEDNMAEQDLQPMTNNASGMIGGGILNANGYTGKGMRIAILDTGILLDHPSFGALPEEALTETSLTREEVDEVWSSLNASSRTNYLNQSYYNTKIPFRFNYDNGSFEVNNTYALSDHGTHVAGITAANVIDDTVVRGVAPDAQLLVMQVFMSGGGAAWDTILAALEDCIRLKADAANLSLGSAAGFVDNDSNMLEVMQRIQDSDMQLLIAAGNDTNNAVENLTGTNMSYAKDPDNGLVGTPSTYNAALSVASVDNDGKDSLYFTVGGTKIGYTDTAATTATKFVNNFSGKTLDYVAAGHGLEEDYENLDVTGKVVLVSRGESSFPEKQSLAQEKGAVACIVYNNVKGSFGMIINDGQGNIPCISISQADGLLMVEQEAKSLTVCSGDLAHFQLDKVMSSFSSWGPAPGLLLKPEITGVGGNIYSCVNPAISGSYYGTMSGTSMATPQITGAMAVLVQYLEENYPELTGSEQRRVAANLLMSTANPILYSNSIEYSPRWQGAGLADLVKATTTPVYFSNPDANETRPKAELGDDPAKTGVYDFDFEITNLSGSAVTYEFTSSIMTEDMAVAGEDQFLTATPLALEAQVAVEGNATRSFLKYDFNDDGAVSTADARVLLRHVQGVEAITGRHLPYADVNGDGTVDVQDVKVITDYCADLTVSVDLLAKADETYLDPVNLVTVPGGETLTLHATLTLTEGDKQTLNAYPNGIYVEGFLYAKPVETEDAEGLGGPQLVMPILGYYGDWSDPDVFDVTGDSLYPLSVYTNYAQLGSNPYIRAGKSGDEYNAFSYANPLVEIDVGMYRNAKKISFSVTDQETGEVYWSVTGENIAKSYYNYSYGMIIPFYVLADESGTEVWNGLDKNGEKLPDGTKVIYKAEAWVNDGDDVVDDSFTFCMTLDDRIPEIKNQGELQNALRTENGRTYLDLQLWDNQHIAAILFLSPDGVIMGKYEVDNVPGEAGTFSFDVTGFGTEFTIVVADYACNELEVDAVLNPEGHNLDKGTLAALDSDRLYGCETFDLAAVEPGWFSAKKADLSDYRNETFDSTNRYYSGEYVNGYVVAQSAITGDLVLVTPSGSYWNQQTLVSQNGRKIGEEGVWVLYDMALDYSDTGSKIYDQWGSCPGTDSLFATGWMYGGDNDNDGKDDGYNALFRIWVSKWGGQVYVDAEARFHGTQDDAEILTLGITTEGAMYGIDTNGKLYSINPERTWNDELSSNVVECTYIGTTDFVNELNYSGINVIQSMGYDHNTDTMYWYAHSQTPSGYRYINVCETYKVNLENADCTEVGTYGPSGMTCLFVPTDLESDLFTMGVDPESFSLEPYRMTMVESQTKKLEINWSPWNAKPGTVTWESSDETLATVDQYGFVNALKSGVVTISAKGQVWDQWAGAWVDRTATCTITIVPSEDQLISYIIEDFKNTDNRFTWVTYSDKTPTVLTQLGKPTVTPVLEEEAVPALWQGGAYYNGYVYTAVADTVEGEGVTEPAMVLYKSAVTENNGTVTIGEPELVGWSTGIQTGNMGFDYNTGRMYCVDLTNGGLAIMDLDTGSVDPLGEFKGDLNAATAPAMCVTADGTIVISDMFGTLYTVDADTLNTTRIGSTGTDTWYYAAMTYDYNTGSIYWNPCMSANGSPLYLVRLEQDEWDETRTVANIMKMGNVSTKAGVEQTVMFTIPENEPETKQIPVQGIEITNGDAIAGLVGGSAKLTTATEPARPTVNTRTWTTSDPSVVTVDRTGKLTYTGVGTATVTVSISNKNPADGGPFTDTIAVTVYESAGEMRAFLGYDEGGSTYYDFWLELNDNDVGHAMATTSSINVYSLRVGCYYDGYLYGYNENGKFMRIDASDVAKYTYLGSDGLNRDTQQVTGMAVDYTTGTMYALSRDAYGVMGALWTVNMDNGSLTKVADLSENVFALAADAEGTLYAAGSPSEFSDAVLYTVDKTTGELTKKLDLPGARAWTGEVYYGTQQYNPAMTYDFGTNRLYLNASSDSQSFSINSTGVYMISLDDDVVLNLGKMGVQTRAGSAVKEGNVALGILFSIPEADEVPVSTVNGIILNKTAGRVAVDGTAVLTAAVRPGNAADKTLTWSSSDTSVATVEDGVVTGVSAGTAVITVTSNQVPTVSAQCTISVVDVSGAQSLAYTASAKTDRLYSFNPALPAQTVEEIGVFSGGSSIKGMAAGDGCIYYVIDDNFTFRLYRYDLTTFESISMGTLEAWTGIEDIAYDPVNDLLYGVGGFYVYQYKDVSKMNGSYNSMSGYCYTMITLSGVSCDEEGNVYYLGNNWGTVALGKTDKLFSSYGLLVDNIDLNIVPGATELAYDSSLDMFYVTDATNNIYTLDLTGKVTPVDILGDGMDINGLAIFPA